MMLKRIIKYIGRKVLPVTKIAQIYTLSDNHSLYGFGIIITGGGSGLGLAMAKKFISEGAKVLITGRREDVLVKAASELGCEYAVLDVTKPDTFEQFFVTAKAKLGRIDALVNNAGVSLHEGSFFDVTPEGFDKQIATNFKGAFFMTQAYIRTLVTDKAQGNVLFISSETGETADCRPYGYTKAAINSMVQGLAYLFKNKGIRINAIAPGITASAMTGVDPHGDISAGTYGQGRFYLPEEVAEVATFILSPASGCISGQIITCNNAQTVNARWK